MRALVTLFLALFSFAPGLSAAAASFQAQVGFQRGVDAYRRADYAEAETLWREVLEEELSDGDRARIYYDLGNAAWRQEEPMEAVGWYTACLRLAPRHADAWHNLELVRAEAGLDPADRGDLRSTVQRLLLSLRPEEARLLALCALGALALVLAFEAFFGGFLWRALSVVTAAGAVVLCLPFFFRLGDDARDPMLVVRAPTVSLRAEPHSSRDPIASLDAGDEVERIDTLPGWVRVARDDGTRGWVQEEALFPLRP